MPDLASTPYRVRHPSTSHFVSARGLRHHVRCWGDPASISDSRPPLVLLHGYMDVAATFQFVVDALREIEGSERYLIAPDLRGFGLSQAPVGDCYWFLDYLADVEAVLAQLGQGGVIDLLGHSMGGNVAMMYAGVRPARVRRLINLEGFGLPDSDPRDAPARLGQWLDELRQPQTLRRFESLEEVAALLRKNNPRLTLDKAAWLATQWSTEVEGRHEILGDPAHKRVNPILYRAAEAAACWSRISAPVLWLEGAQTQLEVWWGGRYSKAEFHQRLSVVSRVERQVVPDAGHMLQHDQPVLVAQAVARFLA